MHRICQILAALCVLLFTGVIMGCASNETPASEVKSAVKTRDNASALQAETDRRTKEGEAVLGGK